MASLYVKKNVAPTPLYLMLPAEEVQKSNRDAVNLRKALHSHVQIPVSAGPRLYLGVK